MMMSQSNKFQILLSYALWDNNVHDLDIIKQNRVDLFLDSGAFTNFTQGKEIVKLDDYIHFVKENKNLVWKYMNLDVIGDAEKSDYNFEIMKSAGLNPVPVFTRSGLNPKERAKELLKLCSENEFIAIGGVAGRLNRTEDKKYLYDTCRFIKKYTKTKFHILGCGSIDVARDIRPYSMDSSASSLWNKYGAIVFFNHSKNTFLTINRKKNEKFLEQNKAILTKYGINSKYIQNTDFWDKQNFATRVRINLYTYFLFQKYLFKNNIKYFQALPVSYFQRFDEMVKYYAL